MESIEIDITYITLLQNRICIGSNGFFCDLCGVDLFDEENVSTHVREDKRHLELLKGSQFVKNLKLIKKEKSIELFNNGIVPFNSKEYNCTFCKRILIRLSHVSEHIKGKLHLRKYKKIITRFDDNSTTNSVTCDDQDKSKGESSSNELISNQEDSKEESSSNELLKDQEDSKEESSSNELNNVQEESKEESSSNEINNGQEECIDESSSSNEFINNKEENKDKNYFHKPPTLNVPFIKCNICQNELQSNSDTMYHSMFHLSQRSSNINDIISFSIKGSAKRIYCMICDCKLKSEADLDRHLKEGIHQKRLALLCGPNDVATANMMYMNTAMYPSIVVPPNINNIYNNTLNTLNVECNRFFYYLGCNVYYNNSFQTAVQQNNHVNNKLIQNDTFSTNSLVAQSRQNMQQNVNYTFSTYICFICNTVFLNENLLFSHYTYDNVHNYRIHSICLILKDENMKFISHSNNEVIKCFKCQIYLIELSAAVHHFFQFQHKLEQPTNETRVTNNSILSNNINIPNAHECPICKVHATNILIMVQHLESDYHRNQVKEYYKNLNSESFEKIVFCCGVCKMNVFSEKILLEHFYHVHGVHSANQNNNFIFVNSTNLQFNGNNSLIYGSANQQMPSNINANYNTSIVSQDTTNQSNQSNKVSNQNRTKNLISFSPRYVKMCVETGDENIFKVHPEKIRKLKLGISLTFPYESERCCIPCGYTVSNDPQLLYEHLRTEEHENNLQDMEEHDEFFENFRDQFSDLDLAKSYMCEDSDEWIKCFTCDTKIENCDETIRNHIHSQSHIEHYTSWKNSADEIFKLFNNMFQNLWYYIEKFFCNICCSQYECEVDYARHLENSKHLKEVEKRIIKQQCLQFDCCILCSCYWYGKSNHFSFHCSRGAHKYILKSRDFSVSTMPTSVKNLLLLSIEQTIDDLIKESDKVFYQRENITKILESVEMIAKSKYPKVKAHLFGSRTSHIGLKNSDLDIYLDCGDQYGKRKSKEECQEQLLKMQECFHKSRDIWIIDDVILRTRVPIIKLRHRFTNLSCDISFFNGLSVEKSKILTYFIEAYLPLRKLILYLKKWMIHCQLSDRRGISTFAISWLVIFYLQVKGILPSIFHLIQLENKSRIVAGWETGVLRNIPVKETSLSIKDLLLGFFSYYAEFDYISNVVCPFLGKVIKKSKFSDINDLPEEMEIYQTQIKEEQVEFFRLDSPMCVQEPIDLSENITKGVTKLHLRTFKQYCAESAASLQL